MTWVVVGLGNPDEEHVRTRHNAGRMAVELFARSKGIEEWKDDTKARAFVSRGLVGKAATVFVLPNTYMNKSGSAVQKFVKSVSAADRMIIVYDELDVPLGTIKISYDRGSGGHKGVDSVMRVVKTKRFTRIRIGISPTSASGEMKKPDGEKQVEKFILGEFKHDELSVLKKVLKLSGEAIECIITKGKDVAMNQFN